MASAGSFSSVLTLGFYMRLDMHSDCMSHYIYMRCDKHMHIDIQGFDS